MAKLMPPLVTHFDDDNGNPLVGGKVFFYEAGTSTPKNTFTDANSGIPNPNPVVLNARGDASIWLTAGEPYKAIIKRADDTVVRTVDFITRDAADDAAYAALESAEAARDVAIAQAGIATAQAFIATEQRVLSETARAGSQAAQSGAEAARDAALLSRGVFASTTDALSKGVNQLSITGNGSGGTNGAGFKGSFTGGAGSAAEFSFTVAGGAIVPSSVVITASGKNYTSAPTGINVSASAGLTGVTFTAGIGFNVSVGEYFSVPVSDSSIALNLYRVDAGPVATLITRYMSNKLLDDVISEGKAWAVADENGFTPLFVDDEGVVHAAKLESEQVTANALSVLVIGNPEGDIEIESTLSERYVYAITDEEGFVAFGVRNSGDIYAPSLNSGGSNEWRTLEIGADDSIVHIGDSYTASHYTVKDKAYISDLSALSPYRHINFGISGNDALDMQYRIVNNTAYSGKTFAEMKARYAFITTLTNDSQFRVVDLTYYAENVRRLVETVRAVGTEPVITTQFPATANEHALLRGIANEYGCAFLDCTTINQEVGGLTVGAFFQGHPGTRTNGVFWLPMLDFIDRMPKPERAIKIFRKRQTFTVGSISDLLYTDRLERSKKWKELTLAHQSLHEAERFEELSQLGTFGYDIHTDEYTSFADGGALVITDYALISVTLDGTASSLETVELSLTTSVSATIYVRDYLDVTASMPGRAQGSTPTDATYLSKWNKPRGAWRQVETGSGAKTITINESDLRRSMQGRELSLLIVGATNLSGLSIRYKGRQAISDLRSLPKPVITGSNLVVQPLCGTAPQLAAWTTYGSPTTLVPVDVYDAPTKPGTTSRIDGVCAVSSSNMIGQGVTLPADDGRVRKYQIRVWARHFPKAWLDPAKYPTFDAAQIIDRTAFPSGATITPDTYDLRTLKAEVWSGASLPAAGGAEFFDFAALQWRAIDFVYEVLPYQSTTLSFRLSCTDGEIQIGKATIQEVI